MQRITSKDANREFMAFNNLLARRGEQRSLSFHQGNSEYKITNKLIIDNTNVWPDGMAGFTARDAYNAFRLMRSALTNFEIEEK